jgi:flagellar secretion chaperone FliS
MSAIKAYQENTVTTQSRGRLIVMLYDGAIKFLEQAIREIEKQDWIAKGRYINRAVAIVDELDLSLDMEAGGEIAMNLRRLYDFLRRHLGQANLHRDPERIRQAITILKELNEGWKTITA